MLFLKCLFSFWSWLFPFHYNSWIVVHLHNTSCKSLYFCYCDWLYLSCDNHCISFTPTLFYPSCNQKILLSSLSHPHHERTVHLWWFEDPGPYVGSVHEDECLKAREVKAVMADADSAEQLQDLLKAQGEELIEIDYAEGGEKYITYLYHCLLINRTQDNTPQLFREYKHVSWTYTEVPGLNIKKWTRQLSNKH